MTLPSAVEELIRQLSTRYGPAEQIARGRVMKFGTDLVCSINYSKLLRGDKYFFGLPADVANPAVGFPKTTSGEYVALICGSAETVIVLPRATAVDMLRDVPSRRLDVFIERGKYILQTTRHPKLDVSHFLNQWPHAGSTTDTAPAAKRDREHVRIQHSLIRLGNAEGCSVWVPPNDRNLAYNGEAFADLTADLMPNFGFIEAARRVVQNIDVLWLHKNVIRKAFEIEATTSIYSGLLRLNDLALSQPNITTELFIAAPSSRRAQIQNQLLRPSFEELAKTCRFVSFETIIEKAELVKSFGAGVQIKHLISGEILNSSS